MTYDSLIHGNLASPIASLTLLDRAIFASVSAMSVFALFSPLL